MFQLFAGAKERHKKLRQLDNPTLPFEPCMAVVDSLPKICDLGLWEMEGRVQMQNWASWGHTG